MMKKIKRKYPTYQTLYPLFSKAIMLRDKYRCRICGGIGTEAAHIFGKQSHPDIALYLPNGLWLCAKCHTLDSNSVHENPDRFKAWFFKHIGPEYWYDLRFEIPPYKNTLEARKYLKDAIAEYEKENAKTYIPSYLIRDR